MALRVSDLARTAGVSADTIRYYERLGLLPEAGRSSSGYRQFDQDDARRLRFIKDAQRLGLSLSDIGELLKIRDDGACPCGHTKTLVQRRLEQVSAEIDSLSKLRDELAALAELECTMMPGNSRWLCEIPTPEGGEPMTHDSECPCGDDCPCDDGCPCC